MRNRRGSALLLIVTSAVLAAWVVGEPADAAWATASRQDSGAVRTVWDGVYTEAQAERGRTAYEHSCSHCHNTGKGPRLVGDAFTRAWFDDGLDVPLRKMRETMPADAPGGLSEAAYLDILSFLLEQTGFPHGSKELAPDPDGLASILVVDKGGPGGPVPNFSLVAIIGCLTQSDDRAWMVTSSTEPVRTREVGESPPDVLEAAASKPLCSQVFRFIQDFPAPGEREPIAGHKVYAKGLLIRQPGDDHLNLIALQSLGETCGS